MSAEISCGLFERKDIHITAQLQFGLCWLFYYFIESWPIIFMGNPFTHFFICLFGSWSYSLLGKVLVFSLVDIFLTLPKFFFLNKQTEIYLTGLVKKKIASFLWTHSRESMKNSGCSDFTFNMIFHLLLNTLRDSLLWTRYMDHAYQAHIQQNQIFQKMKWEFQLIWPSRTTESVAPFFMRSFINIYSESLLFTYWI